MIQMTQLYLSGWWGGELKGAIKKGYYKRNSCGGASTWCLGEKPNEDDEGHLWHTPYENKRYVYVFTPYVYNKLSEKFKELVKFKSFLSFYTCRGYTEYILQTDALLPEYDEYDETWYNYSSDELEVTSGFFEINLQ